MATDSYLNNIPTVGKDPYLTKVSNNAKYEPYKSQEEERLYAPDMPEGLSVGSLLRQLDVNAAVPSAQDDQTVSDMADYLTGFYLQKSSQDEALSPEDKVFASMVMSTMTGRDAKEIINNFDKYSKAFTGVDTGKNWFENFWQYFSGHWDRNEISNATMALTEIPYDSPRRQYYEKYLNDLKENYAKKTANVSTEKGFLRQFAQSGDVTGQRADQLMRSIETGLILAGAASLMLSGAGAPVGLTVGTSATLGAIQTANAVRKAYTLGSVASTVKYNVVNMAKAEGSEIAENLMSMVDEDGNRIPLEIIRQYAYNGGLLSSLTEMGDDLITPIGDIKWGKKTIGEVVKSISSLIKNKPMNYVARFAGNTVFQIGQEGIQGWIRQKAVDEAVKKSNESGATNFANYTPKSEAADSSWEIIWNEAIESLPSMAISELLFAGAGAASAGASYVTTSLSRKMEVTSQMKSDASKYFNEDKGKVYDIRYFDTVGADPVDPNADKQTKEGEKAEEPKKRGPVIFSVNNETGALVPMTQRDRAYVEYLRENGVTGIRGIQISDRAISEASNIGSAGRMAELLDAFMDNGAVVGTEGSTIVFNSQESLNNAVADLDEVRDVLSLYKDSVEFVKNEDGSYTIHYENSTGRLQNFNLRVQTEQDKVTQTTQNEHGEEVTEGNITPVSRPMEANLSDFRSNVNRSEAQWLLDDEVEDASKTFLSQLTGIERTEIDNLWDKDFQSIMDKLPKGVDLNVVEQGARFMPLLSQITGKTTKQLLNDDKNVISLVYGGEAETVLDSKGKAHKARGAFNRSYNKKTGVTTYTIRLTDMASEEGGDTLVHELMHMARRMASKDRLAGFYKAYGKSDLWLEDIKEQDGKYVFDGVTYDTRDEAVREASKMEEKFVRDFFAYLKTGEAPNAEVKSFFDQLKQFLQSFVNTYKDQMSPEVRQAFDKLLNGELDVSEGQTIDEAVKASEATLTDEFPQKATSYVDDEDMYDEEGNPLYSLSPDRDYRQVSFDDFHMATEGTWEYVERNSEAEKEISKKPYDFRSFSGSTYWYDRENNTVYRMSDHWGRVASCVWELDTDEYAPGRSMLGKINLNDLSRIILHNKYYGDYFVGRENGSSYVYPIDENGHIKQSDTLYSLADDKQWQTMDANTQRRIDADYDRIYNQHKDTDQWMKAPNGKPTNLTERQWVQVRTPAFKAWFGDWENDPENASKAVDENGEPKVYLHGSVEDFDVFDVNRIRANESDAPVNGFWFTDRDFTASPAWNTRQYLKEVFLNVRNPASYTSRKLMSFDRELMDELFNEETDKWNPKSRSTQDEMRYRLQEEGFDGVVFASRPNLASQEGQNLVKWTTARGRKMSLHLKDDGYYYLYYGWDEDSDAFITGGWKTATEYANSLEENTLIVFNPNQIKSATDNVGTFSTDNDSILYSLVYHGSGADFNEFLESKIGSGEGSQNFGYGYYLSESDMIGKGYAARQQYTQEYKDFKIEATQKKIDDYTADLERDRKVLAAIEAKEGELWDQLLANTKERIARAKKNGLTVFEAYDNDAERYLTEKHKKSTERSIEINKDIIEQNRGYLEEYKNKEVQRRNLYKIEIPDNTGENYFDWDRIYKKAEVKPIFDALQKRLPEEHVLEDYGFVDSEDFWGASLYNTVSFALGNSDKNASDFMADLGYIGNVYRAGQNMGLPDGVPENTKNYVIYPKNKNQIKMVDHWIYDTDEEAERLYSLADEDGNVEITPEVERIFENAKARIPKDSPWHDVLFSLENVTVTAQTGIYNTKQVTYEVSMTPEEAKKLINTDDEKAPVMLELTNPEDLENAYRFNSNPDRIADNDKFYNTRIDREYTYQNKKGITTTKHISFGLMKKKTTDRFDKQGNLIEDNSNSKVYNQPIFALTKGCQRTRTIAERIANGILPLWHKLESCFGGTCFVNLQRDKIQYGNEFVDTKDLIMVSPDRIDSWFWRKTKNGKVDRGTIRRFIGDAEFIREGAMGDSSHAFPILSRYGRSLAETWLQNMKEQDIRVTNPNSKYFGQPVRTIFITAGYAAVSEESYKRLLPYKDWFEIHVSTSGWFHENELVMRMAEFEKMNELGLHPSLRIITNLDNVDGLTFGNEQKFLNYIYNRIPVNERRAVPKRLSMFIEQREQTEWEKAHPIHMDQILETPYHNDKTGNHSKASGLFGYVCCIPSEAENDIHPNRMTGRCVTCGAGCLARVHAMLAKFPNMPKNLSENMPVETDMVVTDPNNFDYSLDEYAQVSHEGVDIGEDTSESEELYSLSPERQAEVLQQRRNEIQRAVENGIFVRTEFLNEFRGQDWADRELELRDWILEHPQVIGMAKDSDTVEEFRKKYEKSLKNENEDEDIPFEEPTEEDDASDQWFQNIFSYAHALSSQDRDRAFVAEWTSSEDKTLELANALRNYKDAQFKSKPNSRSGGYWYVKNTYGAFKGVSTKLLRLRDGKSLRTNQKERSSSAEIQEAQELIRQNPSAYRRAYLIAQMAESRANQVRQGMQKNIGEEADWMLLEQIDDDIAREMSEVEEAYEAERRPKVDYKANIADIRKKITDAENDIRKAGEDPLTFNAEKAKEDLKGMRQRLKELNAIIRSGEKEVDKIIERMGAKIEGAEEKLAQKRAELAEKKKEYTQKSNEVKRLQRAVDAKTRLIEAREASDYRKKRIRQIRRLAVFNPTSIDATFEDSLIWIHGLFDRTEEDVAYRKSIDEEIAEKKQKIDMLSYRNEDTEQAKQELLMLQKQKKISRMVEPPTQLRTFLPSTVRADNRQSQWTAEELDTILSALKAMRAVGKQMLEARQRARRDTLLDISYGYFNEVTGMMGRLTEEGEMSSRLLGEDIRKNLKEGEEAKGFRRYMLWNAKLQRLARILDGDREGILYDWFVRENYRHQSEEIDGIRTRLDKGSVKWSELGLKASDLSKEGYKGVKTNGTEYSLTRGQMIGVYIYNKSELGREKLTHLNGNEISSNSIKEIINQLTREEIEWAEFMLADMEENYPRLRDVYYRGWNMNLGQRENYFTLVASDSVSQEKLEAMGMDPQGDLVGKDGKAYTNKSFTKMVNPNAIYPLDLDVTRTWARQVRKHEHFIAYGEWAKDTQYLLDQGQVKETAERVFGITEAKNFNKIVNSVIGGQMSNNDFDRAWLRVLASRNSAVLIGNVGTIMKQAPSFFAAFNGDISMRNLINGKGTLENFLAEHPDLASLFPDVESPIDFIYANAPEMKDRQIDIDIMESLNRMEGGAVENALRSANSKISKYTMQLVDKIVVNSLWMSRYYTVFEEQKAQNKTDLHAHREAAFKASQFISETQPTAMRMDQSASQVDSKTSALLRGIMVFTNQTINTFNQMFHDVPMAFRQGNWKKGIQKIASTMLIVGAVSALSGRFFRKGNEDDEKYAWRVARELAATLLQTSFPAFGSIVSSALEYDSDYSTYIFGLDTLGSSLRKIATPSKTKGAWDKIADIMIDLGTEAGYAVGVPVTPIKNVVKSVKKGEAGYLLGGKWGEIIESYR